MFPSSCPHCALGKVSLQLLRRGAARSRTIVAPERPQMFAASQGYLSGAGGDLGLSPLDIGGTGGIAPIDTSRLPQDYVLSAVAKKVAPDRRRCARVPWTYHRYPLVHRPNPYADIPSLYDMYVQASAKQGPMERFGLQVFRNQGGASEQNFRLICRAVLITWLVPGWLGHSFLGRVSAATSPPETGKRRISASRIWSGFWWAASYACRSSQRTACRKYCAPIIEMFPRMFPCRAYEACVFMWLAMWPSQALMTSARCQRP